MQIRYPTSPAEIERLYQLGCTLAHNLRNNMNLFGDADNSILPLKWEVYAKQVDSDIDVMASYESLINQFKLVSGDIKRQVEIVSSAANFMMQEVAFWQKNVHHLEEMKQLQQQQQFMTAIKINDKLAVLESDVEAVNRVIAQQIREIEDELNKGFFKKFGGLMFHTTSVRQLLRFLIDTN